MRIPEFTQHRILVVGDLMLDRYWYGSVNRISPEAPVPVVAVGSQEDRPGGAGNVALNLASLGANATLLGICGNDDAGRSVRQLLSERGVACAIHESESSPTITKLRVIGHNQQLVRLDFEDSAIDDKEAMDPILPLYDGHVGDAVLVVFSDYAKGTLSNIQKMIAKARALGVRTLIDPKGKDFSRYAGAYLLTPNFSEFQAVVGKCASECDVQNAGFELIRTLDLEALVVTRGEDGMTLLEKGGHCVHLRAEAKEVYDVTGAGDTVIAALAAGLSAGMSLTQSVTLANVAAGIVVGKLGTATTNREELLSAIASRNAGDKGILPEAELMSALAMARQRGEKIVATNGCFDILHAGHVQYLAQARELGDRLVVLVNGDESVSRLKGPERPLNSLTDRMTVLAALSCVDWVVAFHEDTPKDLICRIKPDVLVKGGDYTDIKQIAGHDCVLEYGGEVRCLDFKSGYSTTNVITAIKAQS